MELAMTHRTVTLTCRECGVEWERPRQRGRRPVRCPDCRSTPRPVKPARDEAAATARAERWVEARNRGEPLSAIGKADGVTGERVRQVTQAYAPHRPWEALARERKAIAAEVEAVRPPKPCRVCGAGCEGSRAVFCSEEHWKWWTDGLRYFVDDDLREHHRRYALQYAPGEPLPPPDRRWLVSGSIAHRALVAARENGWLLWRRLSAEDRALVERADERYRT